MSSYLSEVNDSTASRPASCMPVSGTPLPREELRVQIAFTLKVSPDLVQVTRQRTPGWRLFQQCWGVVAGTRFFAKIFLVDHYPVAPRFATPWEEVVQPGNCTRNIDEQIKVEVANFQRVRGLMGGQNIPTLLACSLPRGTLIYEEVEGVRIDKSIKYPWASARRPGCGGRGSLETAMYQAGLWLRALHDCSSQAFEMVEPRELLNGLKFLLRKLEMETSDYARLAVKVCEPLGGAALSVRVPVALNHGDFTLPNLLWKRDRQQLWVLDFEHSSYRPVLHDLCTLVAHLRRELLVPFTSSSVISGFEQAFWTGYGRVSEDVTALVNALACARPFYHDLPRILTLRERRGWTGGLKSFLYTTCLQKSMVNRLLRSWARTAAAVSLGGIPHRRTA